MDWALLAASVGLVVFTCGLVYFTKRLVHEATLTRAEMVEAQEEAVRRREEMAEARSLSVRPILAFDLMVLGGRIGMLLIRNVGNGAALDVSLSIAFQMTGHMEPRDWREPSVVPGESHELKLPEFARRDIGTLSEEDLRIVVEGKMQDLYGNWIRVEEDFRASDWWRSVVRAEERVGGRRKLPGVDPRTWGQSSSDD